MLGLINRKQLRTGSLYFYTKDFAVRIAVRRVKLSQDKGKLGTVGCYYTSFTFIFFC